MKSICCFFILITMSFLTACSNAPAVISPTSTEVVSTIVSTPTTKIFLPSATYTIHPATPSQTPTNVPSITPPPAIENIASESNLDFSKYGPIAFIDDLNGSIVLINPDDTLNDWSYTNKDLWINDLSWSLNGELIAISTTGNGLNVLNFQEKILNKINLDSSKWNFEILQYASFSPDGNRLVFNSYNEGKIFRVNLNGSDLINLTPEGGYRNSYEYPSWSPTGEEILFSREYIDGNVYSMNTDGSNPHILVTGATNTQPIYSPTGQWIAFTREFEENSYLYLMLPNGESLKALTDDPEYVIGYSWSPDGRYVVYSYYPDGINSGPLVKKYKIVDIESGNSKEINTNLSTVKPAWSTIMKTAPIRPDCTSGWTHLKIGGFVHNPPGETPNRIRSEPNTMATIEGEFLGGEIYILVDGPVCADNLVFWEIADPRLPGGSGWTAEGDGSDYWLVPFLP